MSSWDQVKRGEKLGLVWRNRKKIHQIIKDHLYLPFFLLIILLPYPFITLCGGAVSVDLFLDNYRIKEK
jgi:hypothetical protein